MKEYGDRKLRRTLIIAALVILAVLYVSLLIPKANSVLSAFMPVLIGVTIAYCLNIIGKYLSRIILPHAKKTVAVKVKKVLTIVIAFILVLAVVVLCIAVVVPELKNTVTALTESFPGVYAKVGEWFSKHSDMFPGVAERMMNDENEPDFSNIISAASKYLWGGVGGIIDSATSIIFSTVDIIYTAVLSVILALFMLAEKERLMRQRDRMISAYVKPQHAGRIYKVLTVSNKTFSAFIVGQTLQAIIFTVLCILFMLIFDFPQRVMVGIFVGVMSFIPMVGSIIGSVVGTLIVLTQSPSEALWFLLFMIVMFQIVGNVIYPKLMGETIGLPSLWVLVAVVVGGALFGVIGMLLGVPVTATVYKLLRADVMKRENQASEKAVDADDSGPASDAEIKTDETQPE